MNTPPVIFEELKKINEHQSEYWSAREMAKTLDMTISNENVCSNCNGTKFQSAPPNAKQPEEQRIKLQDGSLFLMPVGYQDTHLHRIPKHDRPCGWRISLTFRSFS